MTETSSQIVYDIYVEQSKQYKYNNNEKCKHSYMHVGAVAIRDSHKHLPTKKKSQKKKTE